MKPLAMLFYEQLLPGSQLVNRLADLGYRVATVNAPSELVERVRAEKPMVLIADLALRNGDLSGVIRKLKGDGETAHVPILAFADPKEQKRSEAAISAGVKLVAAESGILAHLPQLLDHVLDMEE